MFDGVHTRKHYMILIVQWTAGQLLLWIAAHLACLYVFIVRDLDTTYNPELLPQIGLGRSIQAIIITFRPPPKYIYLSGFHTRCLYWVSRQPSPRNNYSPSPPMKLMSSQSLPPSSARSVLIISHSIDLAGQAQKKNSLTLYCFLTWNSNQSDKISPPYSPDFDTKQVSHPPMDRSGPGLSADTQQDGKPPSFFPATLAWTKQKLSGHCLAKSHRYFFFFFCTNFTSSLPS